MISLEKQQQALQALHRILCHARTMALTGEAQAKIAGVLDWAELLPLDIADEEDRTAHFQWALGGAVGADEKLKWVLDAFVKSASERRPRSRSNTIKAQTPALAE